MVKNFRSKIAADLYHGLNSRFSRKIHRMLHPKIYKLCDQLNAATQIETLKVPPGNHLEKLRGDLKDFWRLQINDQWRMIFKWQDSEACDVDITDYH